MNFNSTNLYCVYPCNNFMPLTSSKVAFKGTQDENISRNIQEAVKAGEKILKLKPKEISINNIRRFFDVPIVPFSQIKDATTEVAALDYKFDGTQGEIIPNSLCIFVPDLKKQNRIAKTNYAMNLTHEYTHAKQIKNGEKENLKLYESAKKSGFSAGTIGTLIKYGSQCYRAISGEPMRNVISKICGEEGRQSYNDNYGMILINRVVSEDDIAQALDFSNADNMRKLLKTNLKSFDMIADTLCNNVPELNNKAKINYSETKETVKKILIEYCAQSSKQEYEAYLAENMIAKKQGYDEKGSEVAYKYHKMIFESLRNED